MFDQQDLLAKTTYSVAKAFNNFTFQMPDYLGERIISAIVECAVIVIAIVTFIAFNANA